MGPSVQVTSPLVTPDAPVASADVQSQELLSPLPLTCSSEGGLHPRTPVPVSGLCLVWVGESCGCPPGGPACVCSGCLDGRQAPQAAPAPLPAPSSVTPSWVPTWRAQLQETPGERPHLPSAPGISVSGRDGSAGIIPAVASQVTPPYEYSASPSGVLVAVHVYYRLLPFWK